MSENLWFTDVFRRYRNGILGGNVLRARPSSQALVQSLLNVFQVNSKDNRANKLGFY